MSEDLSVAITKSIEKIFSIFNMQQHGVEIRPINGMQYVITVYFSINNEYMGFMYTLSDIRELKNFEEELAFEVLRKFKIEIR